MVGILAALVACLMAYGYALLYGGIALFPLWIAGVPRLWRYRIMWSVRVLSFAYLVGALHCNWVEDSDGGGVMGLRQTVHERKRFMSIFHLEEQYVEKNRAIPLTIEESLLDVLHTTETAPATPPLKAIESVRTPEEQMEYSQRISKTLRRDIQWGITRGLFLYTLFMIPVVALIAGVVVYFLMHPTHF